MALSPPLPQTQAPHVDEEDTLELALAPRRSRVATRTLAAAAAAVVGAAFLVLSHADGSTAVGLFLLTVAGTLVARVPAVWVLAGSSALLVLCAPLLIAGADAAAKTAGDLAFFGLAAGVLLALAERKGPHDAAKARSLPRRARVATGAAFVVFAFIPLTWLGAGEMVNGGDTNYPLRAAEYVSMRLSAWNWQIGAGVPNLPNVGTLPWTILAWLFESVTGSPEGGQRIMLVLWFGAVPLSFAFLLRTLAGRWRAAYFVGVLVYALNPIFLNTWSNLLVSTLGAAVAVPLLLGLALRLARRDAKARPWLVSAWAASSLLLSLVSQSPQLLAIVIVLVAAGLLAIGSPIAWRRSFGLGALAVVVNAWWIVPQFAYLFRTEGLVSTKPLETLGLVHWTTGISANTSLLNVFRGAGSWDWYEQWAGEPYVSYAESFSSNPLLVVIGVAIPAAAFVTVAFERTRTTTFFATCGVAGIGLASGLHPPFGFLYSWAMENVPLFGIFRSPWYKFGLVVALALGVLTALGAARATDFLAWRIGQRRDDGPRLLSVAVGALLLVAGSGAALSYGAPILAGEVLLPERVSPPGFRVDVPEHVTEASDWLRRRHPRARILWLPRNSDVYRWGTTTSPQPLISYGSDASVIGEIPFSSSTANDRELALELLNLLDGGRMVEALRIARLLGIEFVLVRRDVDESFYGKSVETPAFLRRMLASSSLRLERTFGPWTIYRVQPRPTRTYGTTAGVRVAGSPRAAGRAATFGTAQVATFVTEVDAAAAGDDVRSLLSDWVAVGRGTGRGEAPRYAIVRAVAARFRARIVDGMLRVERLPQRIRVGVRFLELTRAAVATVQLRGGESGRLLVDGHPSALGDTWYLGPGPHAVTAEVPVTRNLVEDGSFEQGHWMDALDAGPLPEAVSRSGIHEATQVLGGSGGTSALQLLSTGNRTAVYQRVADDAGGQSFSVELDYRSLIGLPSSFALVTEGRTLLERTLPPSAAWRRHRLVFDVPRDATTLDIYLYSNSTGERSLALFDRVRVRRLGVRRRAVAHFTVDPIVRVVPLEGMVSQPLAEPLPVTANLVRDGSFERAAWAGPVDAGPPRGFPGSIRGLQEVDRVRDGRDGAFSLEIRTSGNRAGVYHRVAEQAGGVVYGIAFDYRTVSGRAPEFALVTEGRTLLDRALPSTSSWRRYSLTFQVPQNATTLDLYLYASSGGEPSAARFDDVEVVRVGGSIDAAGANSLRTGGERVELEEDRLSPTRYRVRVRESSRRFLLTLRENFDDGWTASATGATVGAHFRSNGYANAWVIKDAERGSTIELTYSPQQWVRWGQRSSLVSIPLALLLPLLVGLRRRITSAAGTSRATGERDEETSAQ